MWQCRQIYSSNKRSIKVTIDAHSQALTYLETLELWEHNKDFRHYFIDLLAHIPFQAFRWETPAMTSKNSSQAFEFMIIDSPRLSREINTKVFAKYFQDSISTEVTSFHSLGRDSTLIVPCPTDPIKDYSHLAAFTRHAPESQQHTVWATVGRLMRRRLSDKPVWLSTAGAGVAWLHIRLDDKPKYYVSKHYCQIHE